jgi:sec-independent protein translocase protein TatA
MNSIPAVLAWTPGLPELILILVIVLLLFGAKKLPDLARGIGQSIKEFKKGVKEGDTDDKDSSKSGEPKKPNGQS